MRSLNTLLALFALVLLSATVVVCHEKIPNCSHIRIPYRGHKIAALSKCHACCKMGGYNNYRASRRGPGAVCLCRKV